MIIVLNDANFANNNIGEVTVPIELNQKTKDILARVTKYGESSTQAIALDGFVTTLLSAGIYDKLTFLALPAMADTLGECFVNVLDGTDFSPSSTTIYEKSTKGYKIGDSVGGSSGLDVEANKFNLTSVFEGDSFSIGVFNATGAGNKYFGSNGTPYLSTQTTSVVLGTSAPSACTINIDNNHSGSKGLRSLSVESTTPSACVNFCGLHSSSITGAEYIQTWASSSYIKTRLCKSFVLNGYSLNGTNFHHGDISMMFVGEYLTQNELDALNTATNTLMGALGILP